MAVFTVTDLTTDASHGLRGVLGYWDDSASERVAGSAVAGDRVILSMTGTHDMGADDNILYPAAGVWISGPGSASLTIQGRFYSRGSGGTSVVTRLEGWTLDVAGGADIRTLYASNIQAGTCAGVEDVSVVSRDFRVTNSDAASSTNCNNWTIASNSSSDPIKTVWVGCQFDHANRDCFSTKGNNGTAASGSVAEMYNCQGSDCGAGATDQAATPHDGHALKIYGGTWSANMAGGAQAIWAAGATVLEVVNATVTGGLGYATLVDGCIVNGGGVTLGCIRLNNAAGVQSIVRHTRCHNFNNGYGVQLDDGVDCLIDTVECEGPGSLGNGVWAPSASFSGTAHINNLVAWRVNRGVDLRLGTGHTLVDSLISANQYSVLCAPGASNITVTNLTTNQTGFNISPATTTITQQMIDDAVAQVQTLTRPMPNANAAIRSLLVSGGWATDSLRRRNSGFGMDF